MTLTFTFYYAKICATNKFSDMTKKIVFFVISLAVIGLSTKKVKGQGYTPCLPYSLNRTADQLITDVKASPGVFQAYVVFIKHNIQTEPMATLKDRQEVWKICDSALATMNPEVLRPYVVNFSSDYWSQGEYLNHANKNNVITPYDNPGSASTNYAGFEYKGEYATFAKIFAKCSCGNPQQSKLSIVAPYNSSQPNAQKNSSPCNNCPADPNLLAQQQHDLAMQKAAYEQQKELERLRAAERRKDRIWGLGNAVLGSIHYGYSSGGTIYTGGGSGLGGVFVQPGGPFSGL